MKKICSLLCALLMLGLFTGCGGSSDMAAAETAAGTYAEAAPAAEAPAEEAIEEADFDVADSADGLVSGDISVDLTEKIIYTAYAEIETTSFDESINTVAALLSQYNAFIESSSVTGSNLQDSYYGYSSYRTASYTLRVPRENFAAVTSALSSVGNVTYLSNDATNITSQYTDTESRLTAYKTEEARLLEILSKAETVEDMITVESRLSEIRYEMEYLTSQLKNWDNQVSYSTVSLYIHEVEILTPTPVQELTYWQEVGQALQGTVHWMGNAGKTLLKLFIAALPLLLPVMIVVVVILVLNHRKKINHTSHKKDDNREDTIG